ncbi:MAG: hypothetical protein KKF44_10120 [Nanoarchaeota archaeon]|nr:hypothetical protein [Nanoarchaeota archaeon]
MDEYYAPQSKELKEIDKMQREFAIDDFGASANPFQHQTEALKARIFHGANAVEFSFFGAGKSEDKRFTPGAFGSRERRDMLELAEFNKVDTSTHATVGIQGLSGLDQGRFDEQKRKGAIDEVKRAIHFAAEATTGGAIVFHSGEAPRPLYSEFARYKKEDEARFQLYPTEKEEEVHYLVDPVTKEIKMGVKENIPIAIPVPKTDEKGNIVYLRDQNGEYIIDKTFEPYDKIHHGKVPVYQYDEKTGDIAVDTVTFKEYREKREEETKKQGKPITKDFRTEVIKEFFQWQQTLQLQYSYGFGLQAERDYSDALKRREKIIDTLNFYKEMQTKIPKEDWWKVKKISQRDAYKHGNLYIPPGTEDPIEYLEDELIQNDRRLAYGRELALSGRRQATDQLKMIDRSELIDDYAVRMSGKSMGELGVYAWQKQNEAKKEFENGKRPYALKNDLFISPENLFPETYGAHPDELKILVENGRKEMAKELQEFYGKGKKEAEKIAEKHIKATIDIGHMNVWRKYFMAKKGESLESRDKRFNKWLLTKTKDLVDKGIVGHIHVNDNFGFNDEHLSVGDGNAPIKEFLEQAKSAGLKDFIVESSGVNPMRALPDAWDALGSPIYHMHVPGGGGDGTFSDVWHSYFGKTEKPRYIVGSYSPSADFKGAPFYSGLDLEGLQYFDNG